ncbi:MAG: hypothetical protein EAX95_02035 [Candidatus Thorarchaeota archaeon]|nr:hypothetical protein [Candidatus Thorarchaeota archaeon]
MNKSIRVLMLTGAIILLLVGLLSPQPRNGMPSQCVDMNGCVPTTAEDTHWSYEWLIPPYGWHSIGVVRNAAKGAYGEFEVIEGTNISFFICDDWNLDLFKDDEAFTCYEAVDNVKEGTFTFRFPYNARWHFVLDNTNEGIESQNVTLDYYDDITPPEISVNLENGDNCSLIEEIRATAADATFEVYRMELDIDGVTKASNYSDNLLYSWNTTECENNTQYVLTIRASDNVGNEAGIERTVNILNIIVQTTTTTTTTDGLPVDLFIMAGGGVAAVVIIIVIVVLRKK